jgi:hypothetical protein
VSNPSKIVLISSTRSGLVNALAKFSATVPKAEASSSNKGVRTGR